MCQPGSRSVTDVPDDHLDGPPHPNPTERDTGPLKGISPRLESLVVQPWPVHRARTARRVLVALVVLAPLLATAAAWWGLSDESEKVIIEYRGTDDNEHLDIELTAITLQDNIGEMTMRAVFFPHGSLVEGDRLTQDVTLVINDDAGRNIRTFEAGSVMDSLTIVVSVTGDSIRYPFDEYNGIIRVGATVGVGDDAKPLTTDLELTAALDEFAMSADAQEADNSVEVDFDLGRRWAAITWVMMFMVIAWAIALSCAAVTWWIVVFSAATPLWVYALFASVLFALPSLRIGLPGNPRYGVLVDWAAFYWAITIVAFSLVAVLIVWNATTSSPASLSSASPFHRSCSPC